jgi:GNAT superfamily N-acetyltransferase
MESIATLHTSIGQLYIERADLGELNLFMEILDQAADWLVSKGIHQWISPIPKKTWEIVTRGIDRGNVFLLKSENHDQALGTLHLEWVNSLYWPRDPTGAGYVYNLAIRPDNMGLGIGRAILKWARNYVRSQGIAYLRVDCSAQNEKLRYYYENVGFHYRGQVYDREYTAALFEMSSEVTIPLRGKE